MNTRTLERRACAKEWRQQGLIWSVTIGIRVYLASVFKLVPRVGKYPGPILREKSIMECMIRTLLVLWGSVELLAFETTRLLFSDLEDTKDTSPAYIII